MDKKAMVAAILKANQMEAAAEAGLLLLNEEHLRKLMPEELKKEPPTTQAAVAVATAPTDPSFEDRDVLYMRNLEKQAVQQQKAQLIEFITANSRYTPELLATKSLEELHVLAEMSQPVVNYAGQGFGLRGQQEQPKQGAPDIVPPFEIGKGWTKNGVQIAGTPTFE